MKAIITIFLLTICATAFAQLPASGKLKVYKLQSNYLQGTPGSTSLNGSEGIGVFDANGLLTRKVSTAALGLPSGTLNRMAKFTGSSSLGNSTATDSAGYFGFGQVDGSGLGSARFNLKTQGNTSGTLGLIIKNSSDVPIGYINNDGSFSWGATSSLTWSDGSAKLTASNAFQFGTIPNNPLYFITNNTIRTALSSTGFVVNVPLDNTQATSFTGFASGTTAQRPTGAAGYHRANSDSANVLEGYNTTAAAYELYATRNWVRANFGGSDGNGIYGGNGSLPSDVTVTGGNNSLTFDDIFAFKINSDYNVIAKANGTGIYSEAVIGAPNTYEIGYTPTAGVFSKGAGTFIDTNNNVGIGAQPPTAMPLYATGASLFVQGFQSNAGNFYKVSNQTADFTASLATYFYTIDATSGNVTVTLPAASTAFGNTMGITYKFQRIDNSGNTVTVQRAGSDTVNGGTSFTLTAQYQVKQVQCTSTSTWAQW